MLATRHHSSSAAPPWAWQRHLLLSTLAASLLVAGWSDDAQARVRTTRTNVDTSPTAAEVYLVGPGGERALGLTPLKKVRLPRGMVTLRFNKDGYHELVETVQIGRRRQSFVFNLVREVKPATIEFISAPEFAGGAVSIDGKPVGVVPTKASVPPGRHQAIIQKAKFLDWSRWVEVTEAQKVTFDVVMKPAEAPTGSILVSSVPSGAQVRVNGAPKGVSPTVLEGLAPDHYLVELALDGYARWSQTVTVEAGKRAVVDARLEATTAGTGTIKVTSDVQGTTVLLDGEEVGTAPLTQADVSAGTHTVEGRAEGYSTDTQKVQVRGGQTAAVALGLGAATAKSRASLRVVCNVPGAVARMDGGEPQATPLVRDDLRPGTHIVVVSADNYTRWEKTIVLKPGALKEVVAQLQQAGRLEVSAAGKGPAEVFLDGKLLGKKPLIRSDLPAGTYKLLVRRGDGKTEQQTIALGTAKPTVVHASFGSRRRVRHRAMPWSARTVDSGFGTVDMHSGWPFLIGARVNGGVVDGLDLGIAFRSALDTINEFEGHVKYQFLDFRNFAMAAQGGIGFGFGANERNSFLMNVKLLASMMISEKAAVTLHADTRFYSDRVGPEYIGLTDQFNPQYKDRRTVWQLLLGLSVEFRLATHWNGFLTFVGDPVPAPRTNLDRPTRAMYTEGFMSGVGDTKAYGALGVSYLF